jgi:hypothetical protein
MLPLAALLAACSSNTQVASAPAPTATPEERVAPPPASTVTGNTAVTLGVPPGHLPPPGRCRLWLPDTPPGRQPAARSCDGIGIRAPIGSMIVHRPTADKKVVRVRYVDAHRAGVVIAVRVFDAVTGAYLRTES